MNQPFIFKKQIISIIIIMTLFIFIKEFYLIKLNIAYLCVCLSFTFLPFIRSYFDYNRFLHYLTMYLPFYLPVILLSRGSVQLSINILNCLIVGIICFFINFNVTYKSITDKDSFVIPIKTVEYITYNIHNLWILVGEEIFFRMFIISLLKNHIGIYSVAVSCILFIHCHFINRWSNRIYGIKSYIFQLLLSLILSLNYYIYSDIICSVLGHILFNSSQFIQLAKRLKSGLKKDDVYFNDYG